MAASAALQVLLERLAPAAKNTHARARLALEKPDQYAKKFRQQLEDRNVEDEPVDAWLQLVDALGDAKLAFGVDWKASAEDIAFALGEVLKTKKLPLKFLTAPYDAAAHLSTRTDQFIAWCGRALSAHGLSVISLDIESDSFELTVVPRSDVAVLQRAAKTLGGAITSHAPSTPLTSPLPVVLRQASGRFESVATPQFWSDREEWFRAPGPLAHHEKGTTLFDLRRWPPKKRELGAPKLSLACSPRGHEVVHRVTRPYRDGDWGEAQGTLRVTFAGKKPLDLLPHVPDGFDPESIHFVGDLLVLFPTEPTCRDGRTRRPLVWTGKKLEPARGLPDAKPKKGSRREPFPAFLRMGLIECGDGEELLVWEGRVWERHGALAFREVKSLRSLDVTTSFFQGVPGPKGSPTFVYLSQDSKRRSLLTRVSRRDGSQTLLLRTDRRCLCIRTAPDGTVVARLSRYSRPKDPLLLVVHPDGATSEIAATQFGVKLDDSVSAFGRTEDWLWVADRQALKRIRALSFDRKAALL
ncbi:MAG: hypothetical protein QM817_36405 [Archangium sp.]